MSVTAEALRSATDAARPRLTWQRALPAFLLRNANLDKTIGALTRR